MAVALEGQLSTRAETANKRKRTSKRFSETVVKKRVNKRIYDWVGIGQCVADHFEHVYHFGFREIRVKKAIQLKNMDRKPADCKK